jgi:hypothetical protein
MELSPRQQARMVVLRCYHEYVEALRSTHLEHTSPEVHRSRRALARAIEQACVDDPDLLDDFKRTFAARPQA